MITMPIVPHVRNTESYMLAMIFFFFGNLPLNWTYDGLVSEIFNAPMFVVKEIIG